MEIELRAVVESIQVGRTQTYLGDDGKSWESAIGKTTVAGPVVVHPESLEGDQQADRVHHGGLDKAILAYSCAHFDAWKIDFPDCSVSGGTFGENLTVDGMSEPDVCIGDVFQVGSSVLQVSQPRQPCWKLSRKWNLPKLAVHVQKTGRTGWYFRVIETGVINPGDLLELIDRPHAEFSVMRAHKIMHTKRRSKADDLMLSDCEALSSSWRDQLRLRADRPER